MIYQIGQQVLTTLCKGTIIKVHDIGDKKIYTIQSNCNKNKTLTICEEEIISVAA